MPRFGEQLRALRVEAGLTQAAVAEAIGVTNTYVSALESGRKPAPPQALVTALAACLGVDERALWNLALEEREERLRRRIAGVPTSHRSKRTPSPASASRPLPARDDVGAIMESFRDVTGTPTRRKKLARILEDLARFLREADA